MKRKPIYLVTDHSLPELSADDQILSDRIRSFGWPAVAKVWSDPDVVWESASVVVLRSTWDYHKCPEEFLSWVYRAAQGTCVLNPPALVRWNFHKAYLQELKNKGISTIPTVLVSRNQPRKAADLAYRLGWSACVLKPAISCNAFASAVFRNIASDIGREQMDAHLDKVLCFSDALIQPVIEEVFTEGEISLVFLAGEYSHAVRKLVVEQRLGVAIKREVHHPTRDERRIGSAVLQMLCDFPAYARVDLVRSASQLLLLEVELIEPSLYFGFAPGSADKFAAFVIEKAKRA